VSISKFPGENLNGVFLFVFPVVKEFLETDDIRLIGFDFFQQLRHTGLCSGVEFGQLKGHKIPDIPGHHAQVVAVLDGGKGACFSERQGGADILKANEQSGQGEKTFPGANKQPKQKKAQQRCKQKREEQSEEPGKPPSGWIQVWCEAGEQKKQDDKKICTQCESGGQLSEKSKPHED
jgi:hypothetical protein